MKKKRTRLVKEPVQVYLDKTDRSLLDDLAERTGLSRAEILRRGLRKLADSTLHEKPAGWSIDSVIGALGDDPSLPEDLAARHDQYLYGD